MHAVRLKLVSQIVTQSIVSKYTSCLSAVKQKKFKFSLQLFDDCFMFYRLRQIDIELMRCLQDRVNIVPVVAKSDTLTPLETRRLKARVSRYS
jgi:septin family protein